MNMKISVLSDTTYRSCTPDYEHNLSFYGSEPYHAIIAKGLLDIGKHDVHFFAPSGSEPIGTFHPLRNYNGSYAANENLDETSLERPPLTSSYLADSNFDFILDFSAICRNIEDVRNFHDYKNYGVFRNGYNGFQFPRLRLSERNYIVPSIQNKNVFEKHGFQNVTCIYYGVPDFYCAGEDSNYNYINLFSSIGLEIANYYLYPHRPTEEKGSYFVLEFAKTFPQETFVFMVSNNPVIQHLNAMQDLKRQVVARGLKNVKFVELPLTNKHHYYKRELMRQAKAILSPFNPRTYLEGFGLTNAEAVACGTPIIITDSESSRELWIDEKDGLIVPFDNEDRLAAFKMAIRHFSSYNFDPKNKFTVKDCVANYEKFIDRIRITNENNSTG